MAHHTLNVNHTILLKRDNVRMTLLYERINFAIADYEKRHGVKFNNAELADYANVTRQTVGDWRKGRTLELKGANLLRTAAYLEISQSWLSSDRSKLSLQYMRPSTSKAGRSKELMQLIDSTPWLEELIYYSIKSDKPGRKQILNTAKHEASRAEATESRQDNTKTNNPYAKDRILTENPHSEADEQEQKKVDPYSKDRIKQETSKTAIKKRATKKKPTKKK